MIVIDATDYVFGRMATKVAKKALSGEEIHIINAEKFVLIGNPKSIIEKFTKRRQQVNKANPEHAAKWPRVPHMLVKRMIRGMLPWKTKRGKEAYKRIIVYSGNPKKLTATNAIESEKYDGVAKHITIAELCKALGYRG